MFVGFSVTAATFQELDKKYVNVVLLSLVPILFQYIQTQISSSVQAAGTTVEALTAAQFAEYSVPIQGIQYLGNGAFLSSLLLAYVVDKKYFHAAAFGPGLLLLHRDDSRPLCGPVPGRGHPLWDCIPGGGCLAGGQGAAVPPGQARRQARRRHTALGDSARGFRVRTIERFM